MKHNNDSSRITNEVSKKENSILNTNGNEIQFPNINATVDHDNMIEDALYFFPNQDSTEYVPQVIPSPYSYPILESFHDTLNASLNMIKNKLLKREVFDENYKYWYYKENRDIAIDHTASVIATNITNILLCGSLSIIYAPSISSKYNFRYPFSISQYDIAYTIRDFMDSTEFMGELPTNDSSIEIYNLAATQTILKSQIMRCIAEKINDYIRQIIFDPRYPINSLLDLFKSMGKNEIFINMPDDIYDNMINNTFDTCTMIAYGCIQDYLNEDFLKISEVIEANLVFLYGILGQIALSYTSN